MTMLDSHTVTTIDFLRHGVCEGGEIYRGSSDVALTQNGWRQMQNSLNAYEPSWQRVVASPLQRCRAFAEYQAQQYALPLVIDERWREMHFGVWEGRLRSDVWRSAPDIVSQYYREPGSITPEGAEPLVQVQARVIEAWEDLLTQYKGERLLVVLHAGSLRLLLAHILGMPLSACTRFELSYAAFSRVRVDHDGQEAYPSLVNFTPGVPG